MDNYTIAVSTVNKISELLNIPAPEVFTDKPDFFPHNEVSCMYIQSKDTIVFNELWIKEVDTMEVVAMAIHETRHAYQYDCVKNNVNENNETIEAWKDCFDSYNKPSTILDPNDDLDYLNQAIEIDAIAFAYYIMQDWFDMKLIIPEAIKEKVVDRIYELKS